MSNEQWINDKLAELEAQVAELKPMVAEQEATIREHLESCPAATA